MPRKINNNQLPEQVSLYYAKSSGLICTFTQKMSQKKETTPKQTKSTMVKSDAKSNEKNTKDTPELVSFCHSLCYQQFIKQQSFAENQ